MLTRNQKQELIAKLREVGVEKEVTFIGTSAYIWVQDEDDGRCKDYFSYENNEWEFSGREQY